MEKTFNYAVSQQTVNSTLAPKYAEVIGYSVKTLALLGFLREQRKARDVAEVAEFREWDLTTYEKKCDECKDVVVKTTKNLLALNGMCKKTFNDVLIKGVVNVNDVNDCVNTLLGFVLFLEDNYKDTLGGELPWNN